MVAKKEAGIAAKRKEVRGLSYAHVHPQLYRAMSGGWRTVTPEDGTVVAGELSLLGSESLHLLAGVLTD